MPGGKWAPALVVDVDGRTYPLLSKGTLKLGHLKHMEKISTTAELRTELIRLASGCTPGVYREAMVSELYALADRLAATWKEKDGELTFEVTNDDGKWTWSIDEVDGPGIKLYRIYLQTPHKGTLKWKKDLKSLSEAKKVAEGWSKGIRNNSSLIFTDFRPLGKQAAEHTASNAGYEILSGYVGGSAKLQSFLHDLDIEHRTSELLGVVTSKLSEELEPKGRIMSALNRFANLVAKGPKQNPAELRNQIFKVANELGLKLPSGMF